MDVWIVVPGGYDEYGVEGVYESAEAAKAAYPDQTWVDDDDGGFVNEGGDAIRSGSLKLIEKWPVGTLAEQLTDIAAP